MSKLEDSLKHLDSTIDWTVGVLRHLELTESRLDNRAQLACATFSIRQLNYADSIKTLVEAHRSESACVIARVMLEGTACLWWIVKSEHAEKRAENWIKNIYREALKLPSDLEVSAQGQSNIAKIKRDAENLMLNGEVFKGNKWTVDEEGKPVTVRNIIEAFLEAGILPHPHLYYTYQQLSGFVHWSIASFAIAETPSSVEILEMAEEFEVMCVNSAINSLIVTTRLAIGYIDPSYEGGL